MNEYLCPLLAREPEIKTGFDAPSLAFGQAWRAQPDANFRPGEARLGWREDGLWLWAHLDGKGQTRATQNNEPMWMRGDVLELFLAREGEEQYLELHAAPNALTLQLLFPHLHAIESTRGQSGDPFASFYTETGWKAEVENREDSWTVLAHLPFELNPGDKFEFACGRYDCSSGKELLSNTAPLSKMDFHRRKDWQRLVLTD